MPSNRRKRSPHPVPLQYQWHSLWLWREELTKYGQPSAQCSSRFDTQFPVKCHVIKALESASCQRGFFYTHKLDCRTCPQQIQRVLNGLLLDFPSHRVIQGMHLLRSHGAYICAIATHRHRPAAASPSATTGQSQTPLKSKMEFSFGGETTTKKRKLEQSSLFSSLFASQNFIYRQLR